jgi:hypothetical protein
MPDLPPLTLSQAHYDRVVAAFPGSTLAEKANNYKAWLTGQLIDYVFTIEMTAMRRSLDIQAQTKAAEIQASLPSRPAFTPLGTPTT